MGVTDPKEKQKAPEKVCAEGRRKNCGTPANIILTNKSLFDIFSR